MFPNAVVCEQSFVFVDQLGEALREVIDEIEQRALAVFVQTRHGFGIANFVGLVLRHGVWQIAVDTTWAEVSRMHTCTRNRFVHIEQVFALAETINQDVHRAAVKAMAAEPQQVV